MKVFLAVLALLLPQTVSAHEAYVLPHDFFWEGLRESFSLLAFTALRDPHNLFVAVSVVALVLALLLANFFFRMSSPGKFAERVMTRPAFLGPIIVRLAIAASFFFAALNGSFLGPELELAHMPAGFLIRIVLFVASALIAAGFLTEVAAILSLLVFSVGFFVYGGYMITYFNYLGEILVLALFGMRCWSVDRFLFGSLRAWRERWEQYETSVVRVCYGSSLVFAGLSVKLLHPELTLRVVNDWNLTQFHWLFPSDPLLLTLGAGLAEIAIGILIIFGFELRLSVLTSLFFITLSLLYFRELVWPHLLLYGISLNLIIQPEVFTLDHFFFSHHRRQKVWWMRPLIPHLNRGKSAR